MADKILFVDDEPNVLQSLQRSLRKRYKVDIALSGKEALEKLDKDGPYAVIVSDMQMPEMDGAELLSIAKERAPETSRIMLTGNADQQTAINAINHGDILRFLNKPTTAVDIVSALNAGLEQHKLLIAEKELLQNTLRGSVQALAEVLAITNPEIFGRSTRLKNRMSQIVANMALDDAWEWESTAMLCSIGLVSAPADIAKRKMNGARLAPEELDEFIAHASAGAELLGGIPRMEHIAEAIQYQNKYFDGSGHPNDSLSGTDLPLGARLLRPILDLDAYEMSGASVDDALAHLQKTPELYDPKILTALSEVIANDENRKVISVPIDKLEDDMQLASDINTTADTMLVAKGQCTTQSVRLHLLKYFSNGLIEGTVNVWQNNPVQKQAIAS